jgi:EmrB/QacA subfamily drug resistance transporter
MALASATTLSSANPLTARRRWLALAVALTGAFMAIVDAFIVNIALPDIRTSLHASFGQAQFVVAGYALTYAVALITGGRLGDLVGRRRMFMLGLTGFTLASLACGLAPNVTALIGARLLQGLAAAAMFPQVLSLMRVTFTDPRERAIAFALLGAVQGLGAVIGQIGGGLLVSADLWHLGWRPIFLINGPIGLVTVLAALRFIDESRADSAHRLDLTGVAINAAAFTLLLYPLLEGRDAGWPLWSFAMLALAAPSIGMFGWHQHRKTVAQTSPLMDTRLFRHRAFVLGIIAALLLGSILISFFMILAFVLQAGFGLTPVHAALVFAPLALAYALASFLAGRVSKRRRLLLLAGGVILTTGYAITATVDRLAGAPLSSLELVPMLIVIGIGQGLVFTPLFNVTLSSIPVEHSGAAAGVLSTMPQAGGALGVAVVGLLFFGTLHASLASGAGPAEAYRSAFFAALIYDIAAAAVITLLLAALPASETQ